ncbi:hypothetical protein [Hyalangium versicolor]|uniref:hypothetical protein n=1 Tax=Hyalangium versicolor TaxID=2861190 RepID=UPI001CCA388C|nr:hypothetical protein [Hyalangium versicolor]
MARGYSYDHFQVPKREPRERATPPDALKAATHKKGASIPLAEAQEGLHYGQKNSETVKRLHMSAQQRHTGGAQAPAKATRAKAKAPVRGVKAVGRVAAAAKKSVKRVAKKVSSRGSAKKR